MTTAPLLLLWLLLTPTRTMKLDVNVLRYLSKEDFRVLTAVEMGQKNVCGPQLSVAMI